MTGTQSRKTTHLQQELCTLRITGWIPTFKINWLWLEGRSQHSTNKSHPPIICDPKPSSNQRNSVIFKVSLTCQRRPSVISLILLRHPASSVLGTVSMRHSCAEKSSCRHVHQLLQTDREKVHGPFKVLRAHLLCAEKTLLATAYQQLENPTTSKAVYIKPKRWHSATWCLEAYLIFKRK